MPLLGLIPFLPVERLKIYTSTALCQCPYSGLSHFYQEPEETQQPDESVCQCPYSGLSHFYVAQEIAHAAQNNCVNALTRAYPISTLRFRWSFGKAYYVSMPLLGLIPFLQGNEENIKESYVVSMPLLGLIPFLRQKEKIMKKIKKIVSMPLLGLIPFLRGYMYIGDFIRIIVSMPLLGLIPFLHEKDN